MDSNNRRSAGTQAALVLLSAASVLPAATFTVTTVADAGGGSLRQAILDANTNSGADTIVFNIPGGGPYVIRPLSVLPLATDTVVIDGTTQPGYAGTPIIELSTFSGAGLRLGATGSTIRGLVIRDFNTGIELEGTGNHHVEGCFIGTDVTGTIASANGSGISIDAGSLNNTIGGAAAAQRNLISGNSTGIAATNNASTTVIQGNYIGTDVTGTQAIPNLTGIQMTLAAAAIGGTNFGDGNLISGNAVAGIALSDGTGSTIQGNYIGTDVTGMLPIGNDTGIDVGQTNVEIGTSGFNGVNIIGGNRVGISVRSSGAIIHANYIGTNPTFSTLLGNSGNGVEFGTTSSQNMLGSDTINLITSNGIGVRNLGTNNSIRRNHIWANDSLGIDAGPLGVTANDPGDTDGIQNFPLILEVLYEPNDVKIHYCLDSAPNATFVIDFYANDVCAPRPRNFLEGRSWLDSTTVTTDATGQFCAWFVYNYGLNDSYPISATATDASGNTSEFSQRLVFSIIPVSGPPAGGTTVNLAGTNFVDGATVLFGATPGTNVNVTSTTSMSVTAPPLAAGTVSDLTVTNTDGTNGTLPKAWVADFLDVPPGQQFYDWVTKLVSNGIAAGSGNGMYGVSQPTLRQQMAVFLLKGRHGLCYTPPACTGVFGDVPCPSPFADWIEALAAEGITGGCGGGNYCPQNPVRRDQMAVFLLKAEHGPAYVPPPCTGVFPDVPCPGLFTDWIERLAAESITGGCGGGNYCPQNPNTRGQMAVFIDKTFGLQ